MLRRALRAQLVQPVRKVQSVLPDRRAQPALLVPLARLAQLAQLARKVPPDPPVRKAHRVQPVLQVPPVPLVRPGRKDRKVQPVLRVHRGRLEQQEQRERQVLRETPSTSRARILPLRFTTLETPLPTAVAAAPSPVISLWRPDCCPRPPIWEITPVGI